MGELRLFPHNSIPKGWAACNGQFLPINQNQPLFSLLGTTFGGNGQTTFALPDLRGRAAMSFGQGHVLGEAGGTNAVTINIQQLPAHTHTLSGSSSNGNSQAPSNNVLARTTNNIYLDPAALTTLHPQSVSNVGGSQPHENRQPYLKLNWCIALQGVFPSQN